MVSGFELICKLPASSASCQRASKRVSDPPLRPWTPGKRLSHLEELLAVPLDSSSTFSSSVLLRCGCEVKPPLLNHGWQQAAFALYGDLLVLVERPVFIGLKVSQRSSFSRGGPVILLRFLLPFSGSIRSSADFASTFEIARLRTIAA